MMGVLLNALSYTTCHGVRQSQSCDCKYLNLNLCTRAYRHQNTEAKYPLRCTFIYDNDAQSWRPVSMVLHGQTQLLTFPGHLASYTTHRVTHTGLSAELLGLFLDVTVVRR